MNNPTKLDELMAKNLTASMVGLPKRSIKRILESAKPWAVGENWYEMVIESLDQGKGQKSEVENQKSTHER